ncbi:WD repeat- and FYVE domain-containing protein 4 [Varanus komodoensis]|nr:WD repeat- and FYVE domain-containing protein 4 [Varanus komodoensis]
MIWLRNRLLNVLLDVMRSDECHVLSENQEDVFLCMGPDWFLMFIQGHVHSSSVVLAVKLLLFFLHNRTLLQKFRESKMASTWFGNSRMGLDILMDNLKNGSQKPEPSLYKKSGFVALKTLLSNCIQSPEVYFHLSALLLATPGSEPPVGIQPNLDSMLQWLLHNHHKNAVSRLGLCPEAAVLLLEMVKSILKQIPGGPEDSWEITYPGHIMQFFCLMYHSYPQDPLWRNPEFFQALALAVFPSTEPQASAENSTNEQKKFFQTEVLLSIMDIFHMIGQDDGETSSLRGEGDSRGVAEAATPLRLVNLSCFTQKLVEKLCGGMLAADPRKVILFLTEQVTMVKEKLHNEAVLSILHSSLNRAILYYLSSSPSDQQKLLRVLHTLQLQQDVIFAIVNASLDFITCLLYCLIQIQAMSFPEDHTEKERPDFGHEIFLDPSKEGKKMDYLFPIRNVQQDILKTTEEIWIQLLSQRRKDLEDAYKVPFSVETADGDETVKMADVNPLWREILEKAWQHFLASEKKIPQNKVSAQASNKISYWNGSLSSAVKLTPSKNVTQMECNPKGSLRDWQYCLRLRNFIGLQLMCANRYSW